ncbi:MAG: DUF368 domain-containing protein [Defluviitaleaceae bacterium]|nr:DUF368 domain-containing protein [Defluviitaleaceae bacterium]
MLQGVKNFFNGVFFGVGQVIPGVSAGTIAIILGFYDQLIETISHFTEDWRRHTKFIIPFLLGIAVGIVAFSSLIQYLLTYHPFATMLFFTGLIAGIIPSIYRHVKENSVLQTDQPAQSMQLKDIALVLIPIILLVVVVAHLNTDTGDIALVDVDLPVMIFIFVIGIIAAASMLIPGLSGSFVLLVVGIYTLAIDAVSSIRFLLMDFTDFDLMWDIVRVLGPLGVGVVVGVIVMARLIEKLMEKYNREAFLVVLGLLIGSIYALLMEPSLLRNELTMLIIVMGIGSCILGAIISYQLSAKKL